MSLDAVAREYVLLVLALGEHDSDYVDAYYGPAEWRAEAAGWTLATIRTRAETTREAVEGFSDARGTFLAKQLDALLARVDMLSGVRTTFDEESAALYDVVAPSRPDTEYAETVARLEEALPGEGPRGERFERLRARFHVSPERLPAVFDAAIEEARSRTKAWIGLPEGESFRTEYVKDRVWGAYNWYEGDARSLIQVNTDTPTTPDGALHLACHEGYPGHHVYNALLESRLARGKGWVEFTVYPLYSPQSLIAEGTAEYGVDLCFPREERLRFERETLLPLAGLDPEGLDAYVRARELAEGLSGASNDAARRYLDGVWSREETVEWLVAHTLATPERAARSLRFVEHNRSYVVTYGVGRAMVRDYVEARATTPEDRWAVFERLLSTPQTPSGLRAVVE